MKADITRFIRSGGDFEDTALALYRWQRDHCPDYDRFCGDADVHRWSEIPAVPTPLFQDIGFTCFEEAAATVVFRTSGTTVGRRGVIRLMDTAVYDLGSRLHAEVCLGPLPTRGLSLVSAAVDSSLGHMCRSFVPDMPVFFSPDHGVDGAAAWSALRVSAAEGVPLFIPGTAFALADWLDHPGEPVPVPAGSILMVTGGFKGRAAAVPTDALYARLQARMPGARLVGEYGMSELASQLWAEPVGAPFRPPPWMRVLAVEPGSGVPCTRGQLRFFDLANHQTVLAIESEDEGTVHPDGTVTLHGRLPGHAPRGCSLTVEEARDR